MIMGHIGVPEVALIVLAVIVLFGAKKLPEIGSSLGKAIREFKKAGKDIKEDIKDVVEDKNDEQKP